MRKLIVNDVVLDIDDQTAIGIDYQSYDIKQLADTFVKVSNTFTVPATVKNLAVFGLPNNPQSTSTLVYQEATCNYWVDNDLIIDDGRIRVDEIQDRIGLFIFEKANIWETLKTVFFGADFWNDFINNFYGPVKGGYTPAGSHFAGTFADFCQEIADSTEGIILPMTWGNLKEATYKNIAEEIKPLEFGTALYYIWTRLEYKDIGGEDVESYGGHFAVYAKTIFEYIEWKYGVNFLTSGGVLNGNIWDDPIAPLLYIDAKEITIRVFGTSPNLDIYFYYAPNAPLATNFLPHSSIQDKADKTLYDFVTSFIQCTNAIKDEFDINGEKIIRLARFDDLTSLGDLVEFSGLTGKPKYKPFVEGFAQMNYITFGTIFDGGDSLLNSKTINLGNANVDKSKTLFAIDAHVPATVVNGADAILDLSKKEAFKTFTFMISDGLCSVSTLIGHIAGSVVADANVVLPKAALYELDSEYELLNTALAFPVWYEIQKWLTPADLKDFKFFKQYYIRELNGSYFVNKIKGFNPEKSTQPTTLEVLRISDATPVTPPDLDFWVDGVFDPWFDGVNDYWY